MRYVDVSELERDTDVIMDAVELGEVIIVTRDGIAVAKLLPADDRDA